MKTILCIAIILLSGCTKTYVSLDQCEVNVSVTARIEAGEDKWLENSYYQLLSELEEWSLKCNEETNQ